MKIIGITGGIGSGKTTVCRVFESLGVPVYYADDEAKKLYGRDVELKKRMIEHFGNDVYLEKIINKKWLSAVVFNNPEKLQLLNSLVHPAVKRDFDKWLDRHRESPYVIKEAAILIESGSYKDCDKIILVYASEKERLERVSLRDNVSKELVQERMNNQMSEEEKKEYSDYIILNNKGSKILSQVLKVHGALID